MKVTVKDYNEALAYLLREFAHEYNHTFRPNSGIKYAIVYLEEDLKILGYVGVDNFSDIWFDDKAVARLAIELYEDDLIRHFQHKKHPQKMTIEEIEKILGYKVEIVSK